MAKLFDSVVFPLLLPLILLWILLARVLSMLAPFLIVPTMVLSHRLAWACPFIPHIWRQHGWLRGSLMRVGFEMTYTMNGGGQSLSCIQPP